MIAFTASPSAAVISAGLTRFGFGVSRITTDRERVAQIDGPAEFHRQAILKMIHSGERVEQILAYLAVQLRVAGFGLADIAAKPAHDDLALDQISK